VTFQDLLAALGGGGSAAAQQALKPSCRENTADFGIGMGRSMRAMAVFNEVKADYEQSLANVSAPEERAEVLRQVHARSGSTRTPPLRSTLQYARLVSGPKIPCSRAGWAVLCHVC
jgi:hypothetical protein